LGNQLPGGRDALLLHCGLPLGQGDARGEQGEREQDG
jgi:hypothetical protein